MCDGFDSSEDDGGDRVPMNDEGRDENILSFLCVSMQKGGNAWKCVCFLKDCVFLKIQT